MQSTAEYESKTGVRWYREISGAQWRVLAGAWAVWTLDAIDYLSITFVLTDIAKTFGVSLGTTSLLLFATYGVRWLGGLLFGAFSDRFGRKIPLLLCLAWFTLGAAFTGLAWSFTALAVIRLVLGFGMAPGFTLGATMVAEAWPERHRALGIGILDTGWGVGAIGASAIYGFVYPHYGWRAMFYVGIIPAILLGVFILLAVPESPLWQKARAQAPAARENSAITLFRRYPGRVALLAVLMVTLYFGSWPYQGLFPTYLRELKLPTSTITWITMTAAVGQICGFFASGVIAERLGRRLGLTAMLVLGAVCVAALVFVVRTFWLAEVLAFLAAFFLVGSSGIWGTILTENLPAAVRASGVGFLYNVGAIGGGIAPYVVLSTMHRLGISFPLGIALFTLVAAALGIFILRFVRETKGLSLSADANLSPS